MLYRVFLTLILYIENIIKKIRYGFAVTFGIEIIACAVCGILYGEQLFFRCTGIVTFPTHTAGYEIVVFAMYKEYGYRCMPERFYRRVFLRVKPAENSCTEP